ncbi:MAG: hypothetical protein C4294_19570 [Nitrospiraceae bacterium]
MSTLSHKRLLVTLSLVIAGITLILTVQSAYVAPLYQEGTASSFRYTIKGQRNGSLLAELSVNFGDSNALRNHLAVNRQRGQQLSNQMLGRIPVCVTFARPIPLAEARTLAQETGLQVESFALVGRSARENRRGTSVRFGSLDQDVPTRVNVMGSMPDRDDLILKGVMVIYGQLTSPKDLKQLLDDERVYLADTSEVEMRALIAERHAAIVAGKELAIQVPSPFWELDW